MDFLPTKNAVILEWKAGGCKEVDQTFVTWKTTGSSEFHNITPSGNSGMIILIFLKS